MAAVRSFGAVDGGITGNSRSSTTTTGNAIESLPSRPLPVIAGQARQWAAVAPARHQKPRAPARLRNHGRLTDHTGRMWMDSDRDEDELEVYDPPQERREIADHSAYWRRRFLILAGGIVALGLCAWLIPGHDSPKTVAAARQSTPAPAPRNTLPTSAYGPAYVPKPSSTPSPTVSVTTSARAAKKRQASVAHPTVAATGGTKSGTRCAPHDIVLSLFTSAPSYGAHARPTFNVYAVSTAAAACTMTYGAGAVRVVITRQGHVVWDSASCDPPPGSPVRFTLGVPQVLTVAWNRAATAPAGCAGLLPAGATGTFDVVAMAAGQSSPVRTFSIRKS